MREWTLNQAIMIGEYPKLPNWRLWLRHLFARRDVFALRNLDDRMLTDIGVTRADVDWAARLPLKVNASLALQERARRRGRN